MTLSDWKLPEHLNVYQIALLSAGFDPADYKQYSPDWPDDVARAAAIYLTATQIAADTGKIEFIRERDENYGGETNWATSLIETESYRTWLKSRNHRDRFFNSSAADLDDNLLNPASDFYAPKLAAAVAAWGAVTSDPSGLRGKTPKKALEVWLRKHANDYGLTGKDGKPNEQGIEEICKVANWKLQGGASRTLPPSPLKPTHPTPATGGRASRNPPTPNPSFDPDDQVPF